ncbi:MAG: hypothetical protein AAF202_04995 [Pseudomonadota bacterium]
MKNRVIDRTIVSILAMIAITAVAQDNPSVWNRLSVWEQSKAQQNKVEGVVKTFAHDEGNNQYMIKVKTSGGFKTLKICNDGIQQASNQSDFAGGNPNLDTLQQAMDNGDKVSVTYGGTWDSCIKGIKVKKAEKTKEPASEKQAVGESESTTDEASAQDEPPAEDGFADI